MSDGAWSPVIPTGREAALTEEFPGYLRESICRWLKSQVKISSGYVRSDRFVDFQNAYRTDLGFHADALLDWTDTVLPYLRKISTENFTNLIDYFASTGYFPRGQEHDLESTLSDGGSAWTVIRWNESHARLTKRVSDGVQLAVRDVLSATDAASAKLQEAWLDAYGTSPRASVAYSHAVVAVETAALSLIETGKEEPTLGTVITVLEASNPKWRLVLRDNEKAPSAKSLATMMRVLWRGHASRHGRPDYADATLEEARAAVILAATLVQWLTSGVVIPVEA
ncbi:hypothetical protein [Curtobacterium sp. PhB130]|uniref:hypothetical protein n=1 Tax=Curtobacterium sp. PhB130 TaxID=2485178 RepID=UPI0011CDC336|nr:hypothetical protein [Curtobacterium sp. PhB130]